MSAAWGSCSHGNQGRGATPWRSHQRHPSPATAPACPRPPPPRPLRLNEPRPHPPPNHPTRVGRISPARSLPQVLGVGTWLEGSERKTMRAGHSTPPPVRLGSYGNTGRAWGRSAGPSFVGPTALCVGKACRLGGDEPGGSRIWKATRWVRVSDVQRRSAWVSVAGCRVRPALPRGSCRRPIRRPHAEGYRLCAGRLGVVVQVARPGARGGGPLSGLRVQYGEANRNVKTVWVLTFSRGRRTLECVLEPQAPRTP